MSRPKSQDHRKFQEGGARERGDARSLHNDNKISRQSNLHFQNVIVFRGVFPRKKKQRFGRFSSLPPLFHPTQNRKFYFNCRLAVSEMRKFVANCAPNLRKIAGISFRASEEGCRNIVANLKVNFGQFYANTLFQCPFP